MKDTNIKIEANGNFPFSFYIEKAIPGGTEDEMTIKGVASTTNIDHDAERMSESSLQAMATVINEQTVPLRVEHQKEDSAIIGSVNKAWVDERNQLWIEASLNKSHPGASMLYKALKTGAKLGLSVGGRVKHAVKELSEAAGKYIKTFYDVALDEVSVTSRPANYDAWLVSKSIIENGESGDRFVDSPIYKEFLFETPVFDYMQSFAKSVPDNAWKKVDINKSNEETNMKKMEDMKVKKATDETSETKEKAVEETETKEKAVEETETKEKAADTKEATDTEEKFKSMVTKALEGLTSAVLSLSKTSETKEKNDEETTIMEEKSAETETETKEKAAGTKDETETEETATAKASDYDVKMKSIIKRIESMSKSSDETETKEKAAKEEEEDETTKSVKTSDLDSFVDTLTKSLDTLEGNFSKSGKRAPGFAKMFVDMIKNDPEVQKELQGMMKEPGFKKSMLFGAPIMRTKDGQTFRLTASVMGDEVKKSQGNSGKTFKDVYNSNFSSSASREE
jgi:HK97 family phage prohead protease